MPFRIGPTELIIVLVLVLIIFGVGRLPQVGNAMGKAIRQFRKAQGGTTKPKRSASTKIKGGT